MKCQTCQQEKPLGKHGKFCSLPCYWQSLKGCKQSWTQERVEIECEYCKKLFPVRTGLADKKKFCSRDCAKAGRFGIKIAKRGGKMEVTCEECSKEFLKWRYEIDRKYCSKKCQGRGKAKLVSGEKHWNWKGGISPRVLNTTEVREWRKAVFERDNYICQHCGYKEGRILEAHHIKSWKDYPDLRFEVDNGLTLCNPCHKKTDNFGRKGSSNKQDS